MLEVPQLVVEAMGLAGWFRVLIESLLGPHFGVVHLVLRTELALDMVDLVFDLVHRILDKDSISVHMYVWIRIDPVLAHIDQDNECHSNQNEECSRGPRIHLVIVSEGNQSGDRSKNRSVFEIEASSTDQRNELHRSSDSIQELLRCCGINLYLDRHGASSLPAHHVIANTSAT